jgi:hypothetical protein
MPHISSSQIKLGHLKVTNLGVYTPSSKFLQATFAVPLALVYSSYRENWILELLQALNL